MTVATFCRELRLLMPSPELFVGRGLSHEFVERERRSYSCQEKHAEPSHVDPLLDLVVRYDVSHVQVGLVSFVQPPVQHEIVWRLGCAEADPLVIDKRSGEVWVTDLRTGFIVWTCAANGAREASPEACKRAATMCTFLAGGPGYSPFYNMLVGNDTYDPADWTLAEGLRVLD